MATLSYQGRDVWLENAVEIKRSLGLQKGKNDQVDAQRIAEYSYRFMDRVKLYTPKNEILTQVKALYSLREQFVETRKRLKTSIREQEVFMDKALLKSIQKYSHKTLKYLDK